MNTRTLINKVIVSILIITCGCQGVKKSGQSELQEKIQKLADQITLENDVPGLSLSVLPAGGKQISIASGFANVESRTKMDTGRVMFSGSIGKTYAVAILMQLVEEGKIRLQDRFIDYFPELDWLRRLPNIENISIEMLLQHTSGLPRYVLQPELWETLSAQPDRVWSVRDRLEYIFDMQAVHEPGEGWSYSDSNYILLGMLIEKITGSEYYKVANTRLLQPLGLLKTYPANSRSIDDLPQAYSRLPEMFRMPEKVVRDGEYIFNPQMEWTGGGFTSTTSDLARWAGLYYNGGLFQDSLLSKITSPNQMGRSIEPGLSYGMGSFIYETRHGRAYGHTGFVPGFNAIFVFYPEQEIAMAIQVNCDYASEKTRLIEYANVLLDHIIVF